MGTNIENTVTGGSGNTMATQKYPWRMTPIGGSFLATGIGMQTARNMATRRRKFSEQWRVNNTPDGWLFTRLEASPIQRYDWNLQPGQEQEIRCQTKTDAFRRYQSCSTQIYRHNMAVSPTARLWLIAMHYDGLGFTLRRRNV